MQYLIAYTKENLGNFDSDYCVEDSYEAGKKAYEYILQEDDTYSASLCVVAKSTDYEEHQINPKLASHMQDLADAISEKRSDIEEIIRHRLRTGKLKLDWLESRYTEYHLPVENALIKNGIITILHDTLTGYLEYQDRENEWDHCDGHKYSN
jgi:hypothetical protein